MDKDRILEALEIRYVDLRFVVDFPEDCILPRHKSSALRGGMGQMLMAQNCISDGDCENCGFESECPVRKMMYAKYEIQPRFGGQGESMGYIIECLNEKEHFTRGEQMTFHLLLFGKTIIWFSQFLQAFYMLGRQGLGKQHAIYRIIRVENMSGENVVEGDQVWIANLGIDTVRNYVIDRVSEFCEKEFQNTLVFQTPVTIKYQGDFIREFQAEAVIRSILRRIYSFDCFEGKNFELMMWDEQVPAIVSQHAFPQSIRRYSSTQGSKMNLYGIAGDVTFDHLPEDLLLLFVAGEKMHIGKNTSFGFGKYVVQ